MNLIKLLCAPVVLVVAVIEDAAMLVPRKMSDPDAESATMRAARLLMGEES